MDNEIGHKRSALIKIFEERISEHARHEADIRRAIVSTANSVGLNINAKDVPHSAARKK